MLFLGPGGLTRERVGFEVGDASDDYGTFSEGPNIVLLIVWYLCKVNKHKLESPTEKLINPR